METVRLRCPECGGTMEVDADREILSCPYCGSKRLVDVSDDVRIAKIYSEADVRRERIRADRDVQREIIRSKPRVSVDISSDNITMMLLVGMIIVAMLMLFICGHI